MITRCWPLVFALACGGTKATATIASHVFNGTAAWARFSDSALQLSIEEGVDRCANQSGTPNRYRLVAQLSEWNGSALVPATKPGVYTVMSRYCRDSSGQLFADCSVSAKPAPVGSRYVLAELQRDGEQMPLAVLSGSVTLDAVSATKTGTLSGSFAVFIEPQDALSGTFLGSVCEASD